MADVLVKERFNPFLDKVREDNYLGYSRGSKSKETAAVEQPKLQNTTFEGSLRKEVDAPQNRARYVQPVVVDKSLGILFEGIGDVTAGTIATGDNIFKENIKESITEQVDNIHDEFGVSAAASVLGDAQGPVPDGLRQQSAYLDDLSRAYQSGRLRDSHYWAKLDMVARNMRSKYPFYRDYIDNTLSKLTGSVPANALRRALANEATSSDSPGARRTKLVEDLAENGKLLRAAPDFYVREQKGDPYSYDELVSNLAALQKNESELDFRNKQLENQAKERNVNKGYAQDTAARAVWQRIHTIEKASTGAFAKDYKDFQQLVDNLYSKTSGGKTPLSSDDENKLRASWAPLRQSILDSARNTLYNDFAEGHNYAMHIGDEGIDDIMGTVNTYLSNMESALVEGNFGILNFNKAWTEAVETSDKAQILASSDATRILNTAKEVYGPAMLDRMLADGNFSNAANKSLNDLAMMRMGSFGQDAPLSEEFQPDNAEHNNKLLERSQNVILSPDMPSDVRANTAKSLFTSDWTAQLAPNDRYATYSKYTSPNFVQSMVKLRDEGHTDAFDAYMRWSTQNFTQLFRTEAADAQGIAVNRSHMNLRWNPDYLQFEVQDTGSPLADITPDWSPSAMINNLSRVAEVAVMEPAARRSINKFNKAILGFANVIKQTGGDPNIALGTIFASMGVDPTAQKDTSTLFGSLTQSIAEGLPDYQQVLNAVRAGTNPIGALGIETMRAYNPEVKKLGNFVGSVEAPGGYSQVYNNYPTGLSTPIQDAPLKDVFKAQSNMLSQGSVSTAVGKYQITRPTLVRITNKLGIEPNTVFTPEVQDQIFYALAKERGMDQYLAGTMTKEEFAKNLSKEWAGLPNIDTGKSYYAGIAGNKSLVSVKRFLDFLEGLKNA